MRTGSEIEIAGLGVRPASHTSPTSGRRLPALLACLLITACLTSQPAFADLSQSQRPTIPDISYPDLSGTPQNLRQWRGKVLLLNFWASWCSPCLAEIRHLTGFQRDYGTDGLQIVGLGVDEPRKLQNVQRSLQINYPVLVADSKQSKSILKAWGNKTGMIPYTVVFDQEGRIVQAHRGILGEAEFDELVKPLLQHKTD